MTVRFRRSLKIAPGVRINFNTHSTSLSLGPRGAHYTMSSTGRRTVSAGIPGTGLYEYQSYNPKSVKNAARTSNQQASPQPQVFGGSPSKPGIFAGKAEKEFSSFMEDLYNSDKKMTPQEIVDRAKALREEHEELNYPLTLIVFTQILNVEQYQDQLLEMGEGLWSHRENAFAHPIVRKYFPNTRISVGITGGVMNTDSFTEQQFGFIWVELLQAHEKLDEALDVLHTMQATQLVAISMADIELSKKDYTAVLETTDQIENVDEATLILLVLRAIAFREQSLYDASLECLKQALAKKDRDPKAIHRALFERSLTYEKLGKAALAKKDLEMILVDDSSNEEVLKRIKELGS